jgi:ATP-dependent protease Clp ATPase subunit
MVNTAVQKTAENAVDPALAQALTRALGRRSIVLVGMMGAGKSSVGRRLAARLNIPFVDADAEIEGAAGMTSPKSSPSTANPTSAPVRRA